MKIYYAHSMKIYNTLREEEELKFLSSLYGRKNIFCPNNDAPKKWKTLRGQDIMEECFQKISQSGLVICSEYSGYVGKGVFDELQHAQKLRYQTFVLRDGDLLDIVGLLLIDIEWKVKYGKLVTSSYLPIKEKK